MRKCYFGLAVLFVCSSMLIGCGEKEKEAGEALDPADGTETDFSGALDYDPADYVTLGEYKGLSVSYPLPYVDEEDIQMYIYDLVEENKEYNEVDRAVKEGDQVKIDYSGTVDGEEFDRETDYEFTLGQGEFLDDFEKNVIGMKKEETKTFQMTFPEDYYEELAGKTADFTVTLKTVREVITPEYTDELVAKGTEYSSIEEYEDAVREELIVAAQQESEDEAGNNALSMALENAKISGYPQALYDYCYQDVKDSCEGTAAMFGMEPEEVMMEFYGVTDLKEAAVDQVNETMVIQAIAEKEKLAVSEKDYDEEAKNLALENGYESLEEFEGDYSKIEIELLLARGKVLQFLYESSELEEVSAKEYYGEDEALIEGSEDTELFLEEDLE